VQLLLVISDLGYHGAQKQVVELARELDRMGHEVAIYTLNDEAPRASELAGTGVEVIVDQKQSRLDPAVLKRLRRKIVEMDADVVHGFLYDADIYVRLAAIGTGAVVLNSERSDDYEIARFKMWVHRATRFLVDGVVANSRSGADFAQRYFGYKADRMNVVWNGMRVADFEAKAKTDKDHRAEFFGEPSPGPSPKGEGRILAPALDEPALKEAIGKLREAGNVVVVEMPGTEKHRDELACERKLEMKDGKWRVT
jgi:hypothetical protein